MPLDPHTAALFADIVPPELLATAELTLPPCRHLGPELPGHRRVALRLSHERQWHECAAGRGEQGKYVCPCHHCKGCDAYQSEV